MLILRHAWLNLWDKHMTTGRINQVTIRHGRGVGNYRAGASRRTRVRFRTAFRPTSWEPATRERQTSHRPKDAQLSLPRLTLGPTSSARKALRNPNRYQIEKPLRRWSIVKRLAEVTPYQAARSSTPREQTPSSDHQEGSTPRASQASWQPFES